MIEGKKLVVMREDRLKIKYDAETLACFNLAQDTMVQICPTKILVVKTTEASDPLIQLNYEEKRVQNACLDTKTNTVFILVKIGEKKIIEARRSQELTTINIADQITDESISAMSVSTVDQGANLLVLTTEARSFKNSELLIYEI